MFKKIFLFASAVALFAACDNGDYTDWVQPEQNKPMDAVEIDATAVATTDAVIDLAQSGATTKLLDVTLPKYVYVETYNVVLSAATPADGAEPTSYTVHANTDGEVSTEELNNAVIYLFNRQAEVRDLVGTVTADAVVKGQLGDVVVTLNFEQPLKFKMQVIPSKYPEYLYFIGATDGWTASEQRLKGNGNGQFTGFIYCADPNGWGNEFKFQKVAGDWGTEVNNSAFTVYEGAAADKGGNIGVTGGQSVYYFDLDLSIGRISATEVTKMSIIGDFNGWNGDAEMTWNAADFCFEATGVGATANGWKFRVNGSWDLNLGGTLTNLVPNGDNLNVDANKVKLYPCRRTNDNIYCTAE